FQQRRRRKAYRRGDRPRILSSIGYGSPHWVRVLCGVMGSHPECSKTEYLNKGLRDGVRGWQPFVAKPNAYAKVTNEMNGQYHQKRADRNGVVDPVIDAALTPGCATVTLHVAGAESRNQDVLIVSENTTNAIICDVGDIVWVTSLPRLFTAAWNSFVLDEHA